MHEAAWKGDLEMVTLLVELGASTTVRDPEHHATPLGWAAYNKQADVVDYLMARASIFDAVSCGGVERAAALLANDPSLAAATDDDGDPVVFHLHRDIPRLGEMIAMLRAHGADFGVRDHRGRIAEALHARGDHVTPVLLDG